MNIRLIFLLFFTTSLLADTIYLKNGQTIEGKIINQTRTSIQIQTKDLQIIRIEKERIERVVFEPTEKEIEEQEQKRLQEEKKLQEELKRKEEERKRLELQRRQEEIKRRQEELKQKQESLIEKTEKQDNFQINVYFLTGPNIQKPIIGRYQRSLLSAFSKFSLIDQKSQEKSINTGKDKLKDSYTMNTGVVYRNPFLNLGFDFFSIDSTYYFIFFGYNSNTLNLYVNPTKHQFDPYKQLQYKVFLEIDPFMIYLQPPLRFNAYKFYLYISSLDQYYDANLNQTNLVFISNYGGANNLANVFSNTKISINEKGILLGPSIQLNLEPYVMSARYALIKGNASLKYKNNHFVGANILFSKLSVSTIERNARLGGFEFALDLKRTIYNNLFFVSSLRSLEVDYRFNSINSKSFENYQFTYIDNTTPFFSVVDEEKLHYTILDILFGIEYRFDI